MAAVDSICELSLRSRHLASRALEYLVDMFNDEIEEVRLNSIESVHKIISKVDLKEEQVAVPLEYLYHSDVWSSLFAPPTISSWWWLISDLSRSRSCTPFWKRPTKASGWLCTTSLRLPSVPTPSAFMIPFG